MKILIIGAGNMGRPYAESLSKSGLLKGNRPFIYDRNPHKLRAAAKAGILDPVYKLEDGLSQSKFVFLAVKPHDAQSLLEEMKPFINQEQVFISLMAGIKLRTLSKGLRRKKIIRAMPNLPVTIGQGVTTYMASEEISPSELVQIRQLIEMTGRSVEVIKENLLDVSTSISGSGPAYVFYFIEAFMEAGQELGLTEDQARIMVSQTFEGAIQIFNNEETSTQAWITRVASKGGTTEAALDSFAQNKVKDAIKQATKSAFKRAVELGQKS